MGDIRLTHYDDGKEKSQSHEVSIGEFTDWNKKFSSIDFNPRGYGDSYEEAYEDFKNKFYEMLNPLLQFGDLLHHNKLQPTEVDYCNKLVGELKEVLKEDADT